MPVAQKPSNLAKASTVLAPTLSTLAFILIARELGADALGGAALLLSLGACVSLSFDLSQAWGGCGGSSARAFLHLAFLAAGASIAIPGAFGLGPSALLPMGLFVAYHGASSAALAISRDAGWASASELGDAAARIVLLTILLSGVFAGAVATISAAYFAGGLVGLAVAIGRRGSIGIAYARSEMSSVTGAALAFSVLVGLLAWTDKPLLYLLDGNQAQLGGYFAVQRTVVFIASAAIVITGMVGGRFSAIERVRGLRLVTLMERYASLCVVPMAAFYIAFSGAVVATFFGDAYNQYRELVYPLAIAGIFTALAAPSVAWLAEAGRWRFLASLGCISLGVLLSLPVIAVTVFTSADPSTVVAFGCLASAISLYAPVRWSLWTEGSRFHRHMASHVVCACFMAIALFWMSESMGEIQLAGLVMLSLAGILLYGLFLYLFGEFMQGEWTEFKSLRGV